MTDESLELYSCEICKYVTYRRSNMTTHKASKRHNKNIEKNNSECKYFCKLCNYKSNINSHYKRHLQSVRHRSKEEKELQLNNNSNNITFTIETDYDSYEDEKEDNYEIQYDDEKEDEKEDNVSIEDENNLTAQEIKQGFHMMQNMFCELIKSNQQLVNVVQNGTAITTNNMLNYNNNKTFNLQFFLNETCKDAININDFIDSIEVTVSDLRKLGNKGYVEGISSLIIDKLNELDVTKRPIHSSDAKRYTIYIKDDNVWKKDEKNRIKKLLWDIAKLETCALHEGSHKLFPKFEERTSKDHEIYWRIFYNALGGKDGDIDDLQNKVIKKIVKSVVIDKNMVYS